MEHFFFIMAFIWIAAGKVWDKASDSQDDNTVAYIFLLLSALSYTFGIALIGLALIKHYS